MKFKIDVPREKLIITEASRVEYYQLKQHLTRHVKNYKFTPRFKLGVWDGKISHFNEGNINLGLWKECFNLCRKNDWKFEVENKQDFPINRDITYESVVAFCEEFFAHHRTKDGDAFMPYDYQMNAAFQILKNRYCIIEVGTGGGKSLIYSIVAFYILKEMNPKAKLLLIVPNISLVTQFYNDLMDYNLGFVNDNPNPLTLHLEEIMSDRPRRSEEDANIYIGTFQSLEKRDSKWFRQFYAVATDESHTAGSGNSTDIKMVSKVLNNTFGYSYFRFGMSGTFPEDNTVDILTIQSLMGPKIADVRADALMEKGVIAPVKIKALILNHNDPEFSANISIIKKSGNGKAAFDLEKKYVQASDKRVRFVMDKILSRVTKPTLVLFHIQEYGERLYNECRDTLQNVEVYHIDGGTKTEKREWIKKQMEAPSQHASVDGQPPVNPKILIASFGTLSTGVSIKSLCNVIFMESFKSEQIIIQSIGRILRLHKDKETAQVFDVVDVFENSKGKPKNVLYAHYAERKSFYDKRNYPYSELKITL